MVPLAQGASSVSLGAANGELIIDADCIMSAMLRPKMIRLYGDFRPLRDRTIMIAINVDAKHDIDAVVALTGNSVSCSSI